MHFTIAIDGPGGAGKSTVASNVAKHLHVLHLDTGAMYRAFALYATAENVQKDDLTAVQALIERIRIDVRFIGGRQHTFVDGQDVSERIRTPEISRAASDFAVLLPVRRLMVGLQQQLAAKQSMVLDGRDIGTRVLPDATLKIYLTASSEVRAKRRFDELVLKGIKADYDAVLSDVVARDLQDSTRQIDPLTVAEDALVLDTSLMDQAQVEQAIIEMLEKKLMQQKMEAPQSTVEKRERFTPFYRLAMWLSWLLFTILFPVRYHHEERAAMDAPFILIGNHNSMWDPLIVGWKVKRYQIRFLGKKELTKNPITRFLFTRMLMIPVDRHNMDMRAVRACLKTLGEQHVLSIFPEGTRYKKGLMEEMESGVAMIALRSGVPLLPAYIVDKPRLFRRMDCYFGEPFTVEAFAQGNVNKESVDAVMADITARYRVMAADHEAKNAQAHMES